MRKYLCELCGFHSDISLIGTACESCQRLVENISDINIKLELEKLKVDECQIYILREKSDEQ